jgi:predicted DNA-binding transcriptional regulator AlpA
MTRSSSGNLAVNTVQLTEQDVLALPTVVDVPTAAAVLGIGRTAAYELIRTDQWPTNVLRMGKLIRIPTAPLLALVGVSR